MRVVRRYRLLSAGLNLSRYVGWSLVGAGGVGLLFGHGWGPWAIAGAVGVAWIGLMLALVVAPSLQDRLGRFDPVWLPGRQGATEDPWVRATYVWSVGLYRSSVIALGVAVLAPVVGGRGGLPAPDYLAGWAVLVAVLLAGAGWVVRGVHVALRSPTSEARLEERPRERDAEPVVVPETEMWVRVRGAPMGCSFVTTPTAGPQASASRPREEGSYVGWPPEQSPWEGPSGYRGFSRR